MPDKQKTKNKAMITIFISLVFVLPVLVITSLLSYVACTNRQVRTPFFNTPVYVRLGNYNFHIENNYLIWNENGSNYSVQVFNTGYDPLQVIFRENPNAQVKRSDVLPYTGWFTQGAISGHGRVSINSLRLTRGLNLVRVVGGFANYISEQYRTNHFVYAGFFEIFVEHDYTLADYSFNVNERLSFVFSGEENTTYAVFAQNDNDDDFRFIEMNSWFNERRMDIRLERLGLSEGNNTIKVERVLSSEYDGQTLSLNLRRAFFEFELQFDDQRPDFGFNVDRNSLLFDRGELTVGSYRAYISNSDTDGFELITHSWSSVNFMVFTGRDFSHSIGVAGHNTIRVAGWMLSFYDDGVLTINRRVGEWDFEVVNAEADFKVGAEARRSEFPGRVTNDFLWIEGRERTVREWAVFLESEYRLGGASIARQGSDDFERVWLNLIGGNTVIRREDLPRGRSIIRVYEGQRHIYEDGRLYRINRISYIQVRRGLFGRVRIL